MPRLAKWYFSEQLTHDELLMRMATREPTEGRVVIKDRCRNKIIYSVSKTYVELRTIQEVPPIMIASTSDKKIDKTAISLEKILRCLLTEVDPSDWEYEPRKNDPHSKI